MFFLLIKTRLLSVRNTVMDSLHRHPVFAAGLSVLGILLFGIAYIAILLVFKVAILKNVLADTVYQIFYFLFLFLLAGAVPFVASTLLHSSDYGLLFIAPLRTRAVIAAKLLDATITNSLQFTVIGIPAIVACATVIGLPLLGWILIPYLIALFVLLPALLTALGLLIALAALGMRRLRAAIAVVNAVMATVVCVTIVLEAGHLPLRPDSINPTQFTLPSQVVTSSPIARLAPSGWFANVLLSMGEPNYAFTTLRLLGGITLVVGVLFIICTMLGERLLTASSVSEENDNGSSVNAGSMSAGRTGLWRIFSPPVAAIIQKDIRYIWRDSVLLSQLSMPLILFLVPFLIALQTTAPQMRDELFPFAVSMIGVILFMQTSILSLSSIGLESRSFWLMLMSPNSGYALLRAKFIMSTLVTIFIATVLMLFAGVAFGIGWQIIAFFIGLFVFCSAGLCGLGVGISAALPRFIYENPAHRVSAWALILGFFASVGYLMITGILFVLAWILSIRMETASYSSWICAISIAIFLGLTGFSVFVPMAIGARRIEVYQWEH